MCALLTHSSQCAHLPFLGFKSKPCRTSWSVSPPLPSPPCPPLSRPQGASDASTGLWAVIKNFELTLRFGPKQIQCCANLGSPMCVARCRWLSVTEQLLPGPGLPCGVRERGGLYDPLSEETIQACRHPAFLLQAAS